MDKIAVLIPCYNEEKTIKSVIQEFQKEIPEATIYVYDNNSTDETVSIAKSAKAIVRTEPMQGKGNVVRRMFREIDAECYILVDGDLTYSAKDATDMVELVLGRNIDMVVGDRLSGAYFQENKRPFHNSGNNLVKFFVNKFFKVNIKDIMTGYRAMSYEFVKTFPILSGGFEIETEMSIHAAFRRMSTENVTISYKDRPSGSESKLSTFSDGFKVLRTIISLFITYRPMLFFGMIAVILAAVSSILLVPIFITYMESGMVPRFPTLIVSCFILLIALLSFTAGVILKYMLLKDAREYEHKLISAATNKRILCKK